MTASERRRWTLILACAVIATLPLIFRGNSCGHDFDFHLESWMDAARQWRAGVFYPHWAQSANYGAGEPRFVFYPPLSWMLGALLGSILPWAAAPVALTLIAFAGSGASMYALARKWMPPDAAALAACMYLANPYLLFVAYERTAYGELLAAAWLPLLFLFACSGPHTATNQAAPAPALIASKLPVNPTAKAGTPCLASETWASGYGNIVPLALTIAAIWLTNAPAAVMATYALTLVALFASATRRRWTPILQAAQALLLGLGLAAFYVLPAACERRWVEIDRAIGPGMRIEDSFLFGHTGEAFHDQVLRTASWIAIAMLAACAIAACVVWKRRRLPTETIAACAAIAFLLLPVSQVVWHYAPELKFLQFPWRLLLLLGILFAALIGLAFNSPSTTLKRAAVPLLFAAGMMSLAAMLFWQPCDEEDAVSPQIAVMQSGAGFEGTDEYTAKDSDNSAIQQGLPPVRIVNAADADAVDSSVQPNPGYVANTAAQQLASISTASWKPERKAFVVSTRSASFAVLRLMDYPAWRVLVNGAPVQSRPHREDGLLTIPLQPGVSNLQISYSATPDVWWGRGLSTASLLVLCALAANRKRPRHRLS